MSSQAWMSTVQIAELASVCRDTVHSWIVHGVACPGRGRVRLIALRVGGRFRVTPTEWERFLDMLNPQRIREQGEADRERNKRTEAAMKRLGWK